MFKNTVFKRISLAGFSYSVILVAYLFAIVFTYFQNRNSEGYILGDWLINYQDGGFKRRGLSGSFFFLLQDLSGIPLHWLVLGVQFIIISFFFWNYFRIIQRKEVTALYLSLMLSTIGFVGLLNCVDYAGKKEFILFAIFTYFVLLIELGKLTVKREWFVCALLFISVLWHEIVLFFLPYFLIAKYFGTGDRNWRNYMKYAAAVFIPTVAILLFGKEINEGHSLEILRSRGVTFSKGIFFWDIDEKEVLMDRFHNFGWYVLGFLISAAHIWYYTVKNNQIKKKGYIGVSILFAFIYSLPLFYLGLDWGRWLYVHMIMIIILMGTLSLGTKGHVIPKQDFLLPGLIIIVSLIYRVELSGLFTFQGFFYRVFIAPLELIDKFF